MPTVEGMCPWRDQVFTPLFNFATTTNISMKPENSAKHDVCGWWEAAGASQRVEKISDTTMKMRLATVCALVGLSPMLCAATFQNFDFDSAVTNITISLPPDEGVGYGPASDLLPGWQLFKGTNQVSSIGYDLNP